MLLIICKYTRTDFSAKRVSPFFVPYSLWRIFSGTQPRQASRLGVANATPLGVPAWSSKRKPVRRPGGFEIRRKKKVRPIKTGGFVIPQPQQKKKHTPLLRIPNPQSINRLGHFLTPDCKSGGTPSGLAFLEKSGGKRNPARRSGLE